ncbi:MAG: phenylalanine--tRNA ligase subunit alpha, partial [Candidatus Rokubacteria bacterium]|nr:phenylalanine--tRNA ligase subunit alpha [Candidatus Rokubacteria bacterium]
MADKRVNEILEGVKAGLAEARTVAELEALRVKYLGRRGVLTRLLRSIPSLPASERPELGRQANQAKVEIEALLERRLAEVKRAERERELAAERLDLTLPGRRPPFGTVHPLSRVQDEIIEIFLGLGFAVAEGPEVESDFYNFEALNIPKD